MANSHLFLGGKTTLRVMRRLRGGGEICIHALIYAYMRAYMHVLTHTCMYACIYACINTYMHVCVHMLPDRTIEWECRVAIWPILICSGDA